MPKQPTYPPKNQLRALATQLAEAANVPKNRRHEFSDHIVLTVARVRERDRGASGSQPGGYLSEAADAARILHKKFSLMNKEDRAWVEHINDTETQFEAGKIQNVEATISNLSALLHSALGIKAAPVPKPPKSRGGLPNKVYDVYKELGMLEPRVRDQILRELVFGLLRAALETSGKFGFDKNSESGALAKALCLLRDKGHLPPDLVAEPLLTSTIQRLQSEFSRLTR